MKLRTVDGQLTLGSVYKLFVVGWIGFWTAFAALIFLILFVIALVTGEMTINGEVIHGRAAALGMMAPMAILFPVVIVLQAFLFAGFMTGGVWLYRLRGELTVAPVSRVDSTK